MVLEWSGQSVEVKESDSVLPYRWHVGTPYPNPFNPSTLLHIELAETAPLQVIVYNMLGQRVAEIANGTFARGSHKLTFNASRLSSGVYFVHSYVPGHMNEVRKVILMR